MYTKNYQATKFGDIKCIADKILEFKFIYILFPKWELFIKRVVERGRSGVVPFTFI